MIFDSKQFFVDYGLRYYLPGTKNVPKDNIGCRCPFCNDRSNHMHFWMKGASVSCWRCGKKRLIPTIAALLRIPESKAFSVFKTYLKNSFEKPIFKKEEDKRNQLIWPTDCSHMNKKHFRYLNIRGFDHQKLESLWDLKGTGHIGREKNRIVIPVYQSDRVVTWQARDITGKQEPPYLACSPEGEIESIKNCLYGIDKANTRNVIIVEGVTDVWRIGPGAVATFGVEWTNIQAFILSQKWERIFILYDPDEPGRMKGEDLYHYLIGYNDQVEILQLNEFSDPGSMNQDDADYLAKQFKIR